MIYYCRHDNFPYIRVIMNSYKCEACGNVVKAVIRPFLCPKCKARRGMLHKVDEEKSC